MGPLAPSRRLSIQFEEDVGAARRTVGDLVDRIAGVRRGEVELIVTELATNILRHASAPGYLLVNTAPAGLEVLAVDPGGSSTGGTAAWSLPPYRGLGAGLAGVARKSSAFDAYSGPGGTAVLSRIGGDPSLIGRWGGVNVPYRDGPSSGDGWAVATTGHRMVTALIVDGLGHGDLAADAARAALETFTDDPAPDPGEVLRRAHEAMRHTRGGAAGAATIDVGRDTLVWAAVGNVTGRVLLAQASRHLVTRDGTLGGQAALPRLHEERYPWAAGAMLVLATDGIRSHWDLGSYPGLAGHDPAVMAAVLQRDCGRDTDDSTVVIGLDPRAQGE
ncbi:SpoIIE family protein phosphatase [Kribbella sp. NPDC051137]|uniref:SpoIIE family protein phosphatase n=1 Tax=Kribbella sp. NPDC051137 TaxID=3155045 RepID=UPI002F7CB11D